MKAARKGFEKIILELYLRNRLKLRHHFFSASLLMGSLLNAHGAWDFNTELWASPGSFSLDPWGSLYVHFYSPSLPLFPLQSMASRSFLMALYPRIKRSSPCVGSSWCLLHTHVVTVWRQIKPEDSPLTLTRTQLL